MRSLMNLMCLVFDHYLKQRVSFVDIFFAFCGVITFHIYQNPIYFRDGGWMLVTKNVAIENGIRPFSSQGT